jgi:hypothetical protein
MLISLCLRVLRRSTVRCMLRTVEDEALKLKRIAKDGPGGALYAVIGSLEDRTDLFDGACLPGRPYDPFPFQLERFIFDCPEHYL